MRYAVIVVSLSLIASGAPVRAQTSAGVSLAEYEGVYDYHSQATIALVAGDSTLFAVLGDAKYPLRALGADRFLNGAGDTIPFRRGADGVVSGFVERGVYFARRDKVIGATMAAAVRTRARPSGAEGRPLPYSYVAPPDLRDGIPVGDVARAGGGIDSASAARLVARVVDGTYPDVHAILVYHHRRLVVEEYFYGYDRDRQHEMRSLTKSVVSALAGIAIDQGRIEGDTALVTKLLPYEHYANPDPRKDRLTLRDLLTMRSGLACDDWDDASRGNESRMYQSADWVRFILDLPMVDPPGTRGRYCSGNAAVVGRIIERATGTSLPGFAQEHLFTPLGIRARDVRWNYTLDSTNAATFAQINLRPRDMLKLGMLFQQQGRWGGRQVISRDWIARSTKEWSTVGDQSYGYFWWHQWVNAAAPDGPRRVDMIVATGNGGQKIYLVSSLDLVVVLTGGIYNASSSATAIMAREILPAAMGGKK